MATSHSHMALMMVAPTETEQRAYLARHGVETAISGAIARVLARRADDPVGELGRCLADKSHVPPAGLSMPAAEYVRKADLMAAVASGVRRVLREPPADPVAALGALLAPPPPLEAKPSLVAAKSVLAETLLKRPTVEALEERQIMRPSAFLSVCTSFTILDLEKARTFVDECIHQTVQASSQADAENDCLYFGWTVCEGTRLDCRQAHETGAGAVTHLGLVWPAIEKMLGSGAIRRDHMSVMGPGSELAALKQVGDALGCTYWESWDEWRAEEYKAEAASDAKYPYSLCTFQPVFRLVDREKAEPLMAQCIAAAKGEKECLFFGWAICGDKLFCRSAHVSGKSVAAHLANIGPLVGELLDSEAVTLEEAIELHGPGAAIEDAQSACDALGCIYYRTCAGVSTFAPPSS